MKGLKASSGEQFIGRPSEIIDEEVNQKLYWTSDKNADIGTSSEVFKYHEQQNQLSVVV